MSATPLLHRARLLILLSVCMMNFAAAQSQKHVGANHHAATAGRVEAIASDDQNAATHVPGAHYDEATALALSQAAIGRSVGDYTYLDGKGKTISLRSFRGKPLVISLIYTSCYHVCPTVTSNLATLVRSAREALGADSFAVLTIGFDTPNDTPDRMRVFAGQRGIDINDWHFVSASAEAMRSLSSDVGFSFFGSPKGFDHMIQISVLDTKGTLYRQIYGVAPELPSLVEPLKEILWGRQVAATQIEGWINNIKLFCTVYDPTTGKYRFDASPFLTVAIGVLVLSAIAWAMVRSWRGSSSSRPSA